MVNVSINSSSTERAVTELVSRIQTEIIEAGQVAGNRIVSAAEHSAGDFIDSLKTEVTRETEIVNSVGELLIAMANYIQSASNAFMVVDKIYDRQKLGSRPGKRAMESNKEKLGAK